MLRLIVFLLFLIASVWFGIVVVKHPGYLLLVYQPWMVQMPVWFALLAVIVFLLLFYFLIDSIDRLQLLGYRLKSWLRFRREHQSYSKTQQGLAALIEGRFRQAEKWLLAGVSQTVEPLVNYLGAAYAAQKQSALTRRDAYLQSAYQIAPKSKLAIGLTQAELEIAERQYTEAASTLTQLLSFAPRHPRALSLLEKVYVKTSDWKNLQQLLPALYKAKIIDAEGLVLFQKNQYCEALAKNPPADAETARAMWQALPRSIRKNQSVILAYVQQLLRFKETHKECEDLIRGVLKYTWDAQLVLVYSQLSFTNLNRQLVIAGAWLKTYGQKPELLLLLAILCVQAQLWGKAKDYFTKCLALGPNTQASLAYAQLLQKLGDTEGALRVYQDSLEKITVSQQIA